MRWAGEPETSAGSSANLAGQPVPRCRDCARSAKQRTHPFVRQGLYRPSAVPQAAGQEATFSPPVPELHPRTARLGRLRGAAEMRELVPA